MKPPTSASSWTIRRAIAADYPAIVEVWAACGSHFELHSRESEPAFRHQLSRFCDSYLVAVDGGRVIGVVLGSHDERKGWINRLAVLPEYRRRGIASDLVQACDAAIRAQGISIVCALVEPQNEASKTLFSALGYAADVLVIYFRKPQNE